VSGPRLNDEIPDVNIVATYSRMEGEGRGVYPQAGRDNRAGKQ
jgi:hypothetical protein